jgi:SSS family transporter
MSRLDWVVLFAALLVFVAYGVWRGRGSRDLTAYFLAGRSLPWPNVALTVMATQASAITFLSTPGQGFTDGLRFVQFYFGLPLAMVVLCVLAIPIYHRLNVYTAYEYLERRFDGKTRTLASLLFLLQRGLAAGLTIYAPALILSVVLGVDVRWMCLWLGALAVVYTAVGGSQAVSHAHALMFLVILGTMGLAFGLIVASFPPGVGVVDAARLAGHLGKLRAVQTTFDPNDRYNLWSGLIGGFFLQLSYFGTDQSQVGRYLGGQSIAQSRLGLLFNGLFKIPMQFGILLLGVMVFVFYQFTPAPVFYNPALARQAAHGAHGAAWRDVEAQHDAIDAERRAQARAWVTSHRAGDSAAERAAADRLSAIDTEWRAVRARAVDVIRAENPGATTSDTNYVFLEFVLHHLPVGVIGLVLAAIFAASMNSSSAELNALASTTVVDVYQRLHHGGDTPRHAVHVSRIATVAWVAFAVAFAEYSSRLGSLIEAVNILGSLFYGTILGIFLTAFLLPRANGNAAFAGAIVAETVVIACFRGTSISFLWYNVIGSVTVMLVAFVWSSVTSGRRPDAPARA